MRKCKFAMWTEANLHLPCFVGKGYWLRFFHRLWILLTPLTIRNGGWFYCHNLKAAEDINNYPLLSSRDLKKERSRTKVTKIWNILFDCIHPATSCRRWFSLLTDKDECQATSNSRSSSASRWVQHTICGCWPGCSRETWGTISLTSTLHIYTALFPQIILVTWWDVGQYYTLYYNYTRLLVMTKVMDGWVDTSCRSPLSLDYI